MTLRAITFDFWNTLFRDAGLRERKAYRAKALTKVAGCSDVQADTVMAAVYAAFMRCHIEEQRTLTPEDGARLALHALDVPADDAVVGSLAEAFAAAILHHPPALIDGAAEAVALAASTAPVGLVCDSGMSPGRSLRPILESHGLLGHFRVLSFSDEIGVAKPQAPMFAHAASALGVAPAALLHIGDLEPTDIAGIHGVGGQGVLFAGVNRRFLDATEAPHVLDDWRGFSGIVADLGASGNFPEC